jgi:hypothetical protein
VRLSRKSRYLSRQLVSELHVERGVGSNNPARPRAGPTAAPAQERSPEGLRDARQPGGPGGGASLMIGGNRSRGRGPQLQPRSSIVLAVAVLYPRHKGSHCEKCELRQGTRPWKSARAAKLRSAGLAAGRPRAAPSGGRARRLDSDAPECLRVTVACRPWYALPCVLKSAVRPGGHGTRNVQASSLCRPPRRSLEAPSDLPAADAHRMARTEMTEHGKNIFESIDA